MKLISKFQTKFDLNIKQILLMIVFYIGLLFLYGQIPFLYINDLVAYYTQYADTTALARQGIFNFAYVKNYGIELGSPFIAGLPYTYCAAIIKSITKLDANLANNLTSGLFIMLAYLSMYSLLNRLGANKYIAIFCSFLYFILPINYGQIGFGTMVYGFILIPASVFLDFLYLDQLDYKKKANKSFTTLIIVYPIFKTSMLFLDGYSFVFSTLVSGVMFLFYGWYFVKQNRVLTIESIQGNNKIFIGLSVFVIAHFVAVILYKIYVPGGADYPVESIDFFRAQGVDLVTLVKPDSKFLILDLLGFTTTWNGLAFYGDSNNIKNNYLGFTLAFMFGGFLVSMQYRRPAIRAIVVSGILGLALSLGPSLKINDAKEVKKGEVLSSSSYLMPANKATLNLHTDKIYQKVPGIKNIRAVNRWLLVFIFSMMVGCALYLSSMINKNRRMAAFILCILAFGELLPNAYAKHIAYRSNYEQKSQFDIAIAPLSRYVQPNEKVFYLSGGLDYLAGYISVTLGARSYNVPGDKNIALSARTWPASIMNMWMSWSVNDNAFMALSNHQLDKLILPYFDLRWDAYHWPPSDNERLTTRSEKLVKFNIKDPRFMFKEEKWFGVVTLRKPISSTEKK